MNTHFTSNGMSGRLFACIFLSFLFSLSQISSQTSDTLQFTTLCETSTFCEASDGVIPIDSTCATHLNISRNIFATCGDMLTYEVRIFLNDGPDFIIVEQDGIAELDSNGNALLLLDTRTSDLTDIRDSGLPYNDPMNCEDYHRIEWIVNDNCGNETSCMYLIRLEDCHAAALSCFLGNSYYVITNSSIILRANDYVWQDSNACSNDERLLSFDSTEYLPILDLHCFEGFPFGLPHEYTIWAGDSGKDVNCNGQIEWAERNLSSCKASIIFIDSGLCEPPVWEIRGTVETFDEQEIPDVEVKIYFESDSVTTQTWEYGEFYFTFFNNELPKIVVPSKNLNFKNGVNTLDLIKIQKHILGLEAISNPYSLIGADVDQNNTINVFDLIQIRKLLLGRIPKFDNSPSWTFQDKAHQFTNPNEPWDGNDFIIVAPNSQFNKVDFIGIKKGDVNGTVKVDELKPISDRNDSEGYYFSIDDQTIRQEESIEVHFRQIDFIDLEAFQFTLQTEGLIYDRIESRRIEIGEENLGIFENQLTASWNTIGGIDPDADEVLFTLYFTATQDGRLSDMLQMNSSITESEIYNEKAETYSLDLNFVDESREVKFIVYQNEPNPFYDHTRIRYFLPESSPVELNIFDVTGKAVYSKTLPGSKGSNECVVDQSNLDCSGILFYTLNSDFGSVTKKMIRNK